MVKFFVFPSSVCSISLFLKKKILLKIKPHLSYIHFILIAGVPHVYVFLLNRRHVNPLSEDVHDIIIILFQVDFSNGQ
jgi:hypothetical protein